MSLDPVRLAEHVHGHLGWLAAAALAHPAIVLRDAARRAHLAVGLATGLVTTAAAGGLALYGFYRTRLRQTIFVEAPDVGFLFERKEHLAFGAVVVAWAACAAYVASLRAGEDARPRLRRAARRGFAVSFALAVVVAALGTGVAVHRGF